MMPWIPNLLRTNRGGSSLPSTGRTLLARLVSSLILDEGAGAPTWSRATAAWRFNELGLLRSVPSGCAVFGGARLVRNTVRTTSEDFSNAAWTKVNCTVSGTQVIVCANATSLQRIHQDTTGQAVIIGTKIRYCARYEYVSGGAQFIQITAPTGGFGTDQYVNIDLVNGTVNAVGCSAAISTISAGVYEVAAILTATIAGNFDTFYTSFQTSLSSARFDNFVGDGIKSFKMLRAQANDVTGYSSTYVPEYVSVGVVATPFFGAGIDGAKYFTTDQYGAPLSAASLLKFRRENAATNNLLWNRDFACPTYTESAIQLSKAWTPSTTGSELISNGAFPTDLSGWTAAGSGSASVVSGKARLDGTGGTETLYQDVSCVVGKTYYLSCDATSISGSSGHYIRVYTDNSLTTYLKNSRILTTDMGLIFKATNTLHRVTISVSSAQIADFDNISAKECSCIPERTATGLDGIANTATTLTAAATDATILQAITLASAARCASAYVRRKTGTGTISFTQDGGSTWTDITSQLNTSTYTRVEITATLANPSVGFKISTSGDAIEVDGVMNEAGSVATSIILTTTAAVTRNAESLTYQTASNIDTAVGTIYQEAQFTSASLTRRAVVIGSDGYSYINSGDVNTLWKVYDGTNLVAKSGLSNIATGMRKRIVSWGSAGLKVTGDGLTPASGLFDGAFGGGASMEIGQNINGYVGDIAIYNYQMTDAEMMSITT
jgi:hypothetical protein